MNFLLLKNSLVMAGSVTLAASLIGFIVALAAVGSPRRWRITVIGCAVVTLLLPTFLITNCWLHYLGLNGAWRAWLPLNIYSLSGAIFVLAMLYWPLATLACLAAWRRIESSQLEADPALRGRWLVQFLLWPAAARALGLAALIMFVLALNNFAVPAILQVRVLPAHVWIHYNTHLDASAALVASLPLLIAPAILLLVVFRSEFAWPYRETLAPAAVFRRALGGVRYAALGITLLTLVLSAGLPLAHLLSSPETWRQLPLVLQSASGAVTNSFFYAMGAACAALLLGLALWRFKTASLLWLAFLIPGFLIGMLLIFVFNRPGLGLLYGTGAMVVLACTIRYFALAWGAVRAGMESVDPELKDLAQLEGARDWAAFWHIYRPQIAPRAAFGGYVVYLLCLAEVETLVLVLPPGGETLAVRAFNMLHYGHTAQVNALCLVSIVLALAPLLLLPVLHGFGIRSRIV